MIDETHPSPSGENMVNQSNPSSSEGKRNNIPLLVGIAAIVVLLGAFVMYITNNKRTEESFTLQPATQTDNASATAKQMVAGTGASTNPDLTLAVTEAVEKMKKALNGVNPTYAYVTFTTQFKDDDAVIAEVRKQLPNVKIHGITSTYAVMTDQGRFESPTGTIAIMGVNSPDTTFGVAGVDAKTHGTLQNAGKIAITQAIADAGKDLKTPPKVVLIAGTFIHSEEHKILDGIAEVIGKDIPVIGGNAGGDIQNGRARQFTHKTTHKDGIVLTAIYSDKKIGYDFQSAFKPGDKTGIVTKADGKMIYEIDGRPALDVYNEWLDGKLINEVKTYKSFDDIVIYTARNPLCKTIKGAGGQIGYETVHAVPTRDELAAKTVPVYAPINTGDQIALCAATWQTILNRAEIISQTALTRADLKQNEPDFAFLIYCKGATIAVPEADRAKIPYLVKNSLGNNVPFIGVHTEGEQGPLPGIRNISANLVGSLVVVGGK
jgi:hypothetical protein